MSRESFLARVRQAAEAGRPYRVHVQAVPEHVGYVGTEGDPCEALATEIRLVGGEVEVTDSFESAAEIVRLWLRFYQARSVVQWEHPTLDKLRLNEILASDEISSYGHAELSDLPHETQRQIVLAADAGISSTNFAIGETGTLAVFADRGRERMISLVPPVHIAVVEQDQIVPDLFDLFQGLANGNLQDLPSNITLITGPSKTGDIELELTTGVHGPGKWHVVIIRTSPLAA